MHHIVEQENFQDYASWPFLSPLQMVYKAWQNSEPEYENEIAEHLAYTIKLTLGNHIFGIIKLETFNLNENQVFRMTENINTWIHHIGVNKN